MIYRVNQVGCVTISDNEHQPKYVKVVFDVSELLLKRPVSFPTTLCLSFHLRHRGTHLTDSREILYWNNIIHRQIVYSDKVGLNTRHFTWKPRMFYCCRRHTFVLNVSQHYTHKALLTFHCTTSYPNVPQCYVMNKHVYIIASLQRSSEWLPSSGGRSETAW